MFGRRCTLCGGKLDGRRICTECGLDNNQSEKYYKVNQSSFDARELPRQKEKTQSFVLGRKNQKENSTYKASQKTIKHKQKDIQRQKTMSGYTAPKRRKWVKSVAAVVVIISVLGAVMEMISAVGIENILGLRESGGNYIDRNPYGDLEESGYELSEEGEYAEFELVSGRYIVGVNLPEGNYRAEVQDDFDTVQVDDDEHSIYLYEYAGKEGESHLDDLRLFEGAFVQINTESTVRLITENAQPVQCEENPLSKNYEFAGNKKAKAGKDYEPGVYDISVEQGDGIVEFVIFDEEGEECRSWDMYLGEESSYGKEYKNVVLPESAQVILQDESENEDEEFKISMTPSPQIASTDYLEMYSDYYY